MSNKVEMELIGINLSHEPNHINLAFLKEKNGKREMPIVIGINEAESITIAVEKIYTPRPLTHDLFLNFVYEIGFTLQEVIIYDLINGVFHAKLKFTHENDEIFIESRASDAIALSVRNKNKIFVLQHVLIEASTVVDILKEKAEIDTEVNQIIDIVNDKDLHLKFSKEDLQNMLNQAIAEENYEDAAKLRDALNKSGS